MAAVPAAAGVIGKLGLRDLVRKGVVGAEVVLARHRAQPGCVELPAHPVRDAAYAVPYLSNDLRPSSSSTSLAWSVVSGPCASAPAFSSTCATVRQPGMG